MEQHQQHTATTWGTGALRQHKTQQKHFGSSPTETQTHHRSRDNETQQTRAPSGERLRVGAVGRAPSAGAFGGRLRARASAGAFGRQPSGARASSDRRFGGAGAGSTHVLLVLPSFLPSLSFLFFPLFFLAPPHNSEHRHVFLVVHL